VPVRLPHEAIDHGEAEPRALADLLRGEERLEHLFQHLAGHADAGIGDRDHHVLARPDLAVRGRIGLVEMGVGGLDRELAAARHGVAGIDDEIEERAFELVLVGVREPQPAGEHGLNGDPLAKRPPEEIGHAADEPVEVDGLGLQRLAAGEREEPMVRPAARCAPCRAASMLRWAFGRFEPSTARAAKSRLPITTVSRLLKSWRCRR
jgi:hypothetical protein